MISNPSPPAPPEPPNHQSNARLLDFALHQPVDDKLVNLCILGLPLPSALFPPLRKSILLRRLTTQLSSNSISDRTLHSLELIAELDLAAGLTSSAPIQLAYRSVAVECTTCSLRDPGGNFPDAVDRIWKRRLADLEQSESASLAEGSKDSRNMMEEALTSDAARAALLKRDTRQEALDSLRAYLNHANTPGIEPPNPKESEGYQDNVAANLHEKYVGVGAKATGFPRSPTLMERNRMSYAFEWNDDSTDPPLERSPISSKKRRLPSFRARDISPLKLPENTMLNQHRKRRKWSVMEEDTLRDAVKRHGEGQWKMIQEENPKVFEGRTQVDLKDKWRNMKRWEEPDTDREIDPLHRVKCEFCGSHTACGEVSDSARMVTRRIFAWISTLKISPR